MEVEILKNNNMTHNNKKKLMEIEILKNNIIL